MKKWSSDGCKVKGPISGGVAQCECTHLSIFTVLKAKLSLKGPPRSASETFDTAGLVIIALLLAFLLFGIIAAQLLDRRDRELHKLAYNEYPPEKLPAWVLRIFSCRRMRCARTQITQQDEGIKPHSREGSKKHERVDPY